MFRAGVSKPHKGTQRAIPAPDSKDDESSEVPNEPKPQLRSPGSRANAKPPLQNLNRRVGRGQNVKERRVNHGLVETTGKSVDEATDRALAHLAYTAMTLNRSYRGAEAGMFGRVPARLACEPASVERPRPKRSRRSTGGREDRPRNGARNEKSDSQAVEADGVAGRRIRAPAHRVRSKVRQRWTTNRKNLNEGGHHG